MASGKIYLKENPGGWSSGRSEFNPQTIRLARANLAESVYGYIKRPTPAIYYHEKDWLLDDATVPDWEGGVAWVCKVLEIDTMMLQKFVEMGFSRAILDMVDDFDGSDKAKSLLVIAIKKEIKNARETINSYKRGSGIQAGLGETPPDQAG